MLNRHQDRILQDLARSIAGSVDELGADCTARLLASIALGLLDRPRSEESTDSSEPDAEMDLLASAPAPPRPSKQRPELSNRGIHNRRNRTRP